MAAYRFYFHPVRYTSLGLSLCEAMTVGLPVVGLATTELPTIIDHGVNGFVDTDPGGWSRPCGPCWPTPGWPGAIGDGRAGDRPRAVLDPPLRAGLGPAAARRLRPRRRLRRRTLGGGRPRHGLGREPFSRSAGPG